MTVQGHQIMIAFCVCVQDFLREIEKQEREVMMLSKSDGSGVIKRPTLQTNINTLTSADGAAASDSAKPQRRKKKSVKPALNTGRSLSGSLKSISKSLSKSHSSDDGNSSFYGSGRQEGQEDGADHHVGWSKSEGGFDYLSQNNSLFEDNNSATYAPASTLSMGQGGNNNRAITGKNGSSGSSDTNKKNGSSLITTSPGSSIVEDEVVDRDNMYTPI
jgi:hypothetical protein